MGNFAPNTAHRCPTIGFIPVLTADILSPPTVQAFRRHLLSWYQDHRRALPWRHTRDPYRIWVSEIMLQQTRVAAVLEHYKRFLERFPTVRCLASATESDVLAAWSGLGYYRRARMLHRAARQVASESMGLLPNSSAELRKLPGIGRYTANAMGSIAFGEPVAVVDGNVKRVLSRVLGSSLKDSEMWTTAQTILDSGRPGDFNQAMMELGATVCVPGVPLCNGCPVKRHCASRDAIPRKDAPAEVRLRKSASLSLCRRGNTILLRHRPQNESLMPAMWELPQFRFAARRKPLVVVKHSITSTDWTVSVFTARGTKAPPETSWIDLEEINRLPLTGLTRKILRKLRLLA